MNEISRMWRTLALAACICALIAIDVRAGYLYVLNMEAGVESRIYGFQTNEETGSLTPLPGFPVGTGAAGTQFFLSEAMAADPVNGRLYVLNDGPNTLSVYAIDGQTGALAELPYSPIQLSAANWGTVAVHPSGSPVIVGGMLGSFSGIASSFAVTDTSAIHAPGSPFSTGSATPFSSAFSRDGNYFYAGGYTISSSVAGFAIDPATGAATPLPGSPFSVGASNPSGYSTDLEGRLFLVDANNRLRTYATDSGIPAESAAGPVNALAGPIDTVMHPNGQYVFVVGRLANHVASFQLTGSGSLTQPVNVSMLPTGASFSNILAIGRGGAHLFVSNSQSRSLTTMSVDGGTGVLGLINIQPANTLGATGRLVGMALYEEVLVQTNTPAESIQQMIDTINGYDPPLQRGIARALIAKLEDALGCLEAGDIDGAKEKLRAFMNHVRAQSGKHLSPAVADELINAAMDIVAAIDEP